MPKIGRRFEGLAEKYDRDHYYTPREALSLVKELASAKFDETVELNMKLGLDVRKADQQLRGTISLPRGTGRTTRVIVFAQADKAREAREAGADEVGDAELATRIEKGWTDFDVAIATPDMMSVVGKLGRILGPRGLMPNPKTGTVTMDVAKAVGEVKAGRVEYRTDKNGNVHTVIGKASFPVDALAENYIAVIDEILRAKPAAAKGKYMKSLALSTTMGPGIRIDTARPREVDTDGAASPAEAQEE